MSTECPPGNLLKSDLQMGDLLKTLMMKKLLSILLVVGSGLWNTQAQSIFPYLQAKTHQSIYINWISSVTGTPTIVYGTAPTALNMTVSGGQNQFVDGATSYYYNTSHVINLQPNTKYYYRAELNGQFSDTLSFKTSPLPGNAASVDGHMRFMIMGDNQIQTSGRYDSLVGQAKRKIGQKYGGDPSDFIELTFMVGDQVDLGNLNQYKNIHFDYNKALSGYIPIQTTVGNHETYGSMGMNAYYSHFYLDQMTYQGISSGNENYYAYQCGNVLFISLSSEHTGASQFTWLESVLNAADTDTTVDWILTFSHRPYEAEQYVGDISSWVKNTAVPECLQHEKYVMHVGAHHHLYSRGQLKDAPVYNIISGGTAWDQYWGQSNEQDFEYIQKTISNWCYNIVDVDVVNGKIDIETYSIGSPILFSNGIYKNNELVDSFHRYKNQPQPNTPDIQNNFPDSLELPVTIHSGVFSTSTSELLNSTEFEFAQSNDFAVIEHHQLRDFENLYGQAPGQAADSSQDLNAGLNILDYTVPAGLLSNGWHYVRVRHRDRNLEWSNWSPVDSFKVYNSFNTGPYLVMDSAEYHTGSILKATYVNGPGNATDWIGLYQLGNVPGSINSDEWAYCTGSTGIINFQGSGITPNKLYFAGFFELDGYNEVAARDTFYYGSIPVITSDTNAYPVGQSINLDITDAPAVADSVEVLKVGYVHGAQASSFWGAVSAQNTTIPIGALPKGYYSATYYFKGSTVIGQPYYFSVGDTITNLWINQPIYNLGDDIIANWTDAPGIVKDWLGIYNQGDDPNVDPLLIYSYFDGVPFGSKTLSDTLVPTQTGNYFIVMFTNDSYTEVSNRVSFTIVDPSLGLNEIQHGINVYPNPASSNAPTVISSEYPIEFITIYNETGQKIYHTENVFDQKYSLLTEQLPTGSYIIEVQARKLFRYKLIVK